MSVPLVSCILPTYNRREFMARSIAYFLGQDYAAKELIVVDDGSDAVRDLVPEHPAIRYFRLDKRITIGAKRNFACRQAAGEIILHWDDDDWYADWRISYQAARLLDSEHSICGLDRLFYYEPGSGKAWEYIYPPGQKPWVAGNTLGYRKRFWESHPFPEIDVAEDARFVWQAAPAEILRLDNPNFIVGLVHGGNISPKVTSGGYWNARPAERIRELLNADAGRYNPAWGQPAPRPKALVAASLGIGDILRVTPLIGVFHRLGYRVDVLLEPDYPEACALLEGRPEVDRVFFRTSPRVKPGSERLDGLRDRRYEIAAFTAWSAPLAFLVDAGRKLIFDRNEWLRHGDTHCIRKIAVEAGWTGALPPPFAAASNRPFHLEPGTVALHPGCKPDWPWKKWHGFDQLARLLPNVVLVGTASDLDNRGTYFPRPFAWPEHVRNYIGTLSVPDTAALLGQCAALVSNDSGLMHLGVAAGIPTLGVFGITDPARESIDAPNMFPVTKGLACEAPCRTKPFGRADCEYHLQCLKTLSAEEVLARLEPILKAAPGKKPPQPQLVKTATKEKPAMEKLRVIYHGHVFDASGYGQAARAYVHALDRAGVELSVSDLSAHERQVRDPLVESLTGRPMTADFHLFHGIPPIWARQAFSVPNAIGMTVWETDKMPTQWRNTLNHVLEVWLPCDYNVSAFGPQLSRPVFKLPHAALAPAASSPPDSGRLRVNAADFVFYSIFEWQDRKCPAGQLTAYFQAFPQDGPHVFALKCNAGSRPAAEALLAETRRRSGSSARVDLYCEGWNEIDIDILHRRGDCYVSLHRGEGWCYPLFEAACRGTPVVATAYSGPLEYLSPESHQLVPYTLTSVRQPYIYYHPRMQWADPDLADAARQLRWVYENRDEARRKAQAAAGPLRDRHALDAVGEMAKERLFDLLRRSNPPRWRQHRAELRADAQPPPLPVPGEWYDAAYFERGAKSNWEGGYHWSAFQGIFRDAAAYLTSMFPASESFLDAGCAKGFLVRALRERGKQAWGFDASPWAIQHAEAAARPFLKLAGAESADWEQAFDFTLAFDLLSHLTEEQAVAFLVRARAWTKAGLLAVIALPDEKDPAKDVRGNDLSHVTLKDRAWWHALFVQAGWRKDGLHAVLERACQLHPLPLKMGWQVFLYAPA